MIYEGSSSAKMFSRERSTTRRNAQYRGADFSILRNFGRQMLIIYRTEDGKINRVPTYLAIMLL